MAGRDEALAGAATLFEARFRALLAELVAIPSTSQEADAAPQLHRYLEAGLRPWLERLGFAVTIHDNPEPGFGPILTAERIEDPARPTILTYGHCRATPFEPH